MASLLERRGLQEAKRKRVGWVPSYQPITKRKGRKEGREGRKEGKEAELPLLDLINITKPIS